MGGFFNSISQMGKYEPLGRNGEKAFPDSEQEEINEEKSKVLHFKRGMRVFCVILILIICYSCHNKEVKREYYDNGQLKFEVEFKDDIIHGYHKEFHENGTLKTLSHADNGVFRDTIRGYYDNGNLEFIQFKVDNVDSMHIFHKNEWTYNLKSTG